MWESKEFKTAKQRDNFINRLGNKYQTVEVFINNGYCIEYRRKLVINFD